MPQDRTAYPFLAFSLAAIVSCTETKPSEVCHFFELPDDIVKVCVRDYDGDGKADGVRVYFAEELKEENRPPYQGD